jgi:hypothetical protein
MVLESLSYECLSCEDFVNEFNVLVSNMVNLSQQGEKLHELTLNKKFGEIVRSDIFRQLSNRAKFMERKKAELLSAVNNFLVDLELEKMAIDKYIELLNLWHRRALARLEEVELLKKKLMSLIITSQECSIQLEEQLLIVGENVEQTSPTPDQLISSLLQRLEEFAEREKLYEPNHKAKLDF